jgi:hypothetical protein
MSWKITGTQKTDPDALAYLAEVERADGQALESGVRNAVIAFVTGCKADGIWNAIKASCILAGARTLTGALVPLVGTAPTPFNLEVGDYNRKTGLAGNVTNKALNTNRNNAADPQDNKHMSVFVSSAAAPGRPYLATADPVAGASIIIHRGNNRPAFKINVNTIQDIATTPSGFLGASRIASNGFTARAGGSSVFFSSTSETPAAQDLFLHRAGSAGANGDGRASFYSIGESLDLALLDARVTALINAFDAAI